MLRDSGDKANGRLKQSNGEVRIASTKSITWSCRRFFVWSGWVISVMATILSFELSGMRGYYFRCSLIKMFLNILVLENSVF